MAWIVLRAIHSMDATVLLLHSLYLDYSFFSFMQENLPSMVIILDVEMYEIVYICKCCTENPLNSFIFLFCHGLRFFRSSLFAQSY